MSIEHFWLTAVVVLWIYVLLCLRARLWAVRLRRARRARKLHRIERFFTPGAEDMARDRSFRRNRTDARDDRILEYLVEQYTGQKERYSARERAVMTGYMREILHQRIRRLRPGNEEKRQCLRDCVDRSRILSDEISAFLKECCGPELRVRS